MGIMVANNQTLILVSLNERINQCIIECNRLKNLGILISKQNSIILFGKDLICEEN